MGTDEDRDDMSVPPKPPIDVESWCTTKKQENIKYSFAWTIENFSQEMVKTSFGNDNELESTEFTVPVGDPIGSMDCKLYLYPNGETAEEIGNIHVFLLGERLSPHLLLEPGAVSADVYILDKNCTLQNKRSFNQRFEQDGKEFYGGKLLEQDDLRRSDQYLSDDKLTIVCKISIERPQRTTVCGFKRLQNEDELPISKPAEQMMSDLEFAYNDEEFSDVKIVCGDRTFYCHRVILSSRSSVFRAMFQHGMAEAQNRRVEIEDMRPDVVASMLLWIYTGKLKDFSSAGIGNHSKFEEKLLFAADKYDLGNLKLSCENTLCEALDISNCTELLALADLYNAPKLKERAMKLVVKNMKTVVQDKAWKEKILKDPSLVTEVMQYMANTAARNLEKRRGDYIAGIRYPDAIMRSFINGE